MTNNNQTKKTEPSATHLKLHIFLGSFIAASLLGVWVAIDTNSPPYIFVFNTIGYPFALMFGAIPATLTALTLHVTSTTNTASMKILYAFFVGFCVCFLFFYPTLQGLAIGSYAIKIVIIGGVTSSLIQCFALSTNKKITPPNNAELTS